MSAKDKARDPAFATLDADCTRIAIDASRTYFDRRAAVATLRDVAERENDEIERIARAESEARLALLQKRRAEIEELARRGNDAADGALAKEIIDTIAPLVAAMRTDGCRKTRVAVALAISKCEKVGVAVLGDRALHGNIFCAAFAVGMSALDRLGDSAWSRGQEYQHALGSLAALSKIDVVAAPASAEKIILDLEATLEKFLSSARYPCAERGQIHASWASLSGLTRAREAYERSPAERERHAKIQHEAATKSTKRSAPESVESVAEEARRLGLR